MASTAAVVSSSSTSCKNLFSVSVLKCTSSKLPLSQLCVQNRRNLRKNVTASVLQEEVKAETEGAEEKAMVMRLQNTKLYIGNLPYHCDSEQLASVIEKHAKPELIEVHYDKETGRSRGFAFVTMRTIQDCEAVIANLNAFQYDGRTLRVKFSDKAKSRAHLQFESEFKLFVGNLSWSMTSEALKQVFKEYGDLVSARIIYDGETGRSRGYGFVCFSTKEDMDAAMESLNGVELEGRALKISLALGRKTSLREELK